MHEFSQYWEKKRTIMHRFTCCWKKKLRTKTKNLTILNENTSCPCGNTGEEMLEPLNCTMKLGINAKSPY